MLMVMNESVCISVMGKYGRRRKSRSSCLPAYPGTGGTEADTLVTMLVTVATHESHSDLPEARLPTYILDRKIILSL